MQAKMPATKAECAAQAAAMIAGPRVLGADRSVADAHLFTVAGWLDGDGVPIAGHPRLAAHRAAMPERPAVQRVLAREAAALSPR